MIMDTPEFKPGMRLAGRYLLQEHLGNGGMGTVWLAKDEELNDEQVATKLLLPELARDSQFINSLKDEAMSSRKLTHENIVQVYNFARDEQNASEVAFLVLKYIKGGTMKEVLQDWPQGVPLERVMRWAQQIASALDYAHANGVLHRDIKPSNIMIDASTDTAMLMDFGISRQCDQTIRSGTKPTSGSGTGTPAYMSPQQLHDKDCKANDIYSLAATLYQALSGRPPFIGSDIEEQVLRNDAKPIDGIPEAVNRALLAGLAKDELDRPETAEDLVDLMSINVTTSDHSPVVASSTKRAFPWGKAAVASIVLAGAGWLALSLSDTPVEPEPVSPTPMVVENVPHGGATPNNQEGGGSAMSSRGNSGADQGLDDSHAHDGSGHSGTSVEEAADVPSAVATGPDDDEIESDGTPEMAVLVNKGTAEDLARALTQAKASGSLLSDLSRIDPNTGYALIHTATATGRTDMVRTILEHGANPDQLGTNPRRVTPLIVAAEMGHSDVSQVLLASGADVNGTDSGGNTALHEAAARCRNQRDLALLEQLIQAGAEREAQNINGRTPADLIPQTSRVIDEAKEMLS